MRMIRYVDHVAITVKDLDRSAEFYTKLGFSVLREAETPSLKIMFVGNRTGSTGTIRSEGGGRKRGPASKGQRDRY